MSRGGPGSNGSSGFKPNGNTTATSANGRDIYQQLIDNDMVKELDDIEAISQQISQHAEVLYNSWKNNNNNSSSSNGMSHVVAPTSPTSPINTLKRNNLLQQSVSPSLEDQSNNTLSRDLRERGGGRNSPAPSSGGSPYANGYGGSNGGSVTRGYTVPIKTEVRNGGPEERPTVKISYPGGSSSSQYGSLDRQNLRTNSVPANFSTNSLDRHGAFNSSLTPNGHHSVGGGYNSQQQPGRNSASLSRNSSFSSPPSSSRESPAKGTKSFETLEIQL